MLHLSYGILENLESGKTYDSLAIPVLYQSVEIIKVSTANRKCEDRIC
jgi:hypothetical protein